MLVDPSGCVTSTTLRIPKALSGGQRQRVAMGRAMVRGAGRGRWNAEKLIPAAVALMAARPDLEGVSLAGRLDEAVRWGA